jgi:hypothetical protein
MTKHQQEASIPATGFRRERGLRRACTLTYQTFVRYSIIFAVHVALILALMAYYLTG